MKFHRYETMYQHLKKIGANRGLAEGKWHRDTLQSLIKGDEHGMIYAPTLRQIFADAIWLIARKPYYCVWPGVIRCLKNLNLSSVQCESIRLPLASLTFQFSSDVASPYVLTGTKLHLKSMLVHELTPKTNLPIPGTGGNISQDIRSEKDREWTIWMDFGETTETSMGPIPDVNFRRFCLKEGATIGDCMESNEENVMPDDTFLDKHDLTKSANLLDESVSKAIVSLICSCCLLADGEFVEPDVLNRDKGKSLTQTIIDRARRNGRYGWHVGRELTVSPHWRNPHPALYWTGPGRKVPKIIFRKGSLVKRELAEKIPTGRAMDDD